MIDTLRSICEQCTHLNNPRLDFVPSRLTRHKEIILSIDSVRAAHDEQKLGSSLKLGYEVCEGGEDVDRQL